MRGLLPHNWYCPMLKISPRPTSAAQYLKYSANEPPVEKYYSLIHHEDLIQVHRHASNLVLGRDLRRNVRYSARMARELADQGQKVFYLNTYASDDLLREAFGPDIPEECPVTIYSLPTGYWKVDWILKEIAGFDVLIINSYEFTALTRSFKQRLATELIDLQRETHITLVTFSHALHKDLEAGCGGRGPLGLLAAVSVCVSRVGPEWKAILEADANKKQKALSIDTVHEKQMLRPALICRKFGGTRPDPTVEIPNDRAYSYHYADYWCNPFERGPYADYSGRAMSLLARTPLLQQYLLEHPDQIFGAGNTPTEARLRAEQLIPA